VLATGADIPLGHCSVSAPSFAQFEEAARVFLAGHSPDVRGVPGEDGSDIGVAAWIAGAVVLSGLGALIFWGRRRRA
jgi:hypothetical protein